MWDSYRCKTIQSDTVMVDTDVKHLSTFTQNLRAQRVNFNVCKSIKSSEDVMGYPEGIWSRS